MKTFPPVLHYLLKGAVRSVSDRRSPRWKPVRQRGWAECRQAKRRRTIDWLISGRSSPRISWVSAMLPIRFHPARSCESGSI
jgi:hypothetical protein